MSERIQRAQWGMLGEWWCIPVDATEAEQTRLAEMARDGLCGDFANCPLEYIKDRLFGGFGCNEWGTNRHVYFSTGNYSFLAAEQGRFWPLSRSDRWDVWQKLLAHNANHRDGPFTDDVPPAPVKDEE